MKITLQLVLALIASSFGLAEQGGTVKPIPAAEARKMIGTNAAVVGKIVEVHKTEKVIRLNFEEKFPKQTFTAVVFARNFNTFTNLDGLEGKTVEVSGPVTEYRGRPEMVLSTNSQLRIVAAEKNSRRAP